MKKAELSKPILKFKPTLKQIHVDHINVNPDNPREPISKREVSDIRESIRAIGGVLVPLVVYEESPNEYILLDGERRWRACKQLSRDDPRFKYLPANVIEEPLEPFDNLQTMFNIHLQRKDWSTAATAQAIGELRRLRKDLTVTELSQKTGLHPTRVKDALLFLEFPSRLREKCLEGELNEYYLILLGRNLESLEKTFPSLMKRYKRKDLATKFMKKVEAGWIKRTRDFNKIHRMARTCIEYNHPELFEKVFQKMVDDEGFTPRDAEATVARELGYKLELAFRNSCKDFLSSLKSYLKTQAKVDRKIPLATLKVLDKINRVLQDVLHEHAHNN